MVVYLKTTIVNDYSDTQTLFMQTNPQPEGQLMYDLQ